MGVHDVLDDHQPEPHPLGIAPGRVRGAEKGVEDPFAVLGADADAVVLDLDLHAVAPGHEPDGDFLPPLAVLYSIIHQVQQGLPDGVVVGFEDDGFPRHLGPDLEALGRRAQPAEVHDLLDERLDGRLPQVVELGVLLDLGEVEDVVDEPRQAAALPGHELEEPLPLGLVLDLARPEELGQALERGHGRPELVRNGRDELGLEPAELVGLFARGPLVEDLLLEPDPLEPHRQLAGHGLDEVEVLPGEPLPRLLPAEGHASGLGPGPERQEHDRLPAQAPEQALDREIQPLRRLDGLFPRPGDARLPLEGKEGPGRPVLDALEKAEARAFAGGLAHGHAYLFERQDLGHGPAELQDEVLGVHDLLGPGVEVHDGLPVVIALAEERLVHGPLDAVPGRLEHGRDQDGGADRDRVLADEGRPDKEGVEELDDQQIGDDHEHGQEGIDEAAVDDQVDVHQPVPEDGQGQAGRDEDEEGAGRVLGHELAPRSADDLRELVEEDERREADGEPEEDPLELGPDLLRIGLPEGPDHLHDGGQAGEGHVGPEDGEIPDRDPERLEGRLEL